MNNTDVALPVRDRNTRSGYRLSQLTMAWLAKFVDSPGTAKGYRRHLFDYLEWCARRQVDPLKVRSPEVQMFSVELHTMPSRHSGKILGPATISRCLAAVSSFYDYLVLMDAIDVNPAKSVPRPRTNRRQSAVRPVSKEEMLAIMTEARRWDGQTLTPAASSLVVGMLAGLGVRAAEVYNARIEDQRRRGEHDTIRLNMKGHVVKQRALPPGVQELISKHLAERGYPATGFLVARKDGSQLSHTTIYHLVRRLARKAGIDDYRDITPHSFRHGFNTVARAQGYTIEERQDALGHRDLATTQRYDHTMLSADRDPAYGVSELFM
jgi:integrase/recombinase XerD